MYLSRAMPRYPRMDNEITSIEDLERLRPDDPCVSEITPSTVSQTNTSGNDYSSEGCTILSDEDSAVPVRFQVIQRNNIYPRRTRTMPAKI